MTQTEIIEQYDHDHQIVKVTKSDGPPRFYFENPLDHMRGFESPDAGSSTGALWASTVRLYDDLPSFEHPEYGTYTFDREAAIESLPDPSD